MSHTRPKSRKSDVIYEDKDVCILQPNSSRGILLYHASTHTNICSEGLLTYNEVRKRHPELKMRDRKATDINKNNDVIKFRAPFTNDLTNFQTTYGSDPRQLMGTDKPEVIVIIRVDPDKTFVYSSEARSHGDDETLIKSRLPLRTYLKRITGKMQMKVDYPNEMCGNILTYETKVVHTDDICHYPWIKYLPIERNAEVIIDRPHIPTNWFVACHKNGAALKGGRRPRSKRRRTIRRK
jgi:hypothetical protein